MLPGRALRGSLLAVLGGVLLAACAHPAGRPAPVKTVTVTAPASPASSPPAFQAGPLLQPEACQRVVYGADGNPGPVLCPDGHPNAYAMPALQGTAPHMFSLGQFATASDVTAAACADLARGSTNPIEDSAYKFMKALNGWNFAVDPTDGGLFTGCG